LVFDPHDNVDIFNNVHDQDDIHIFNNTLDHHALFLQESRHLLSGVEHNTMTPFYNIHIMDELFNFLEIWTAGWFYFKIR
jgi:hypothetical protein